MVTPIRFSSSSTRETSRENIFFGLNHKTSVELTIVTAPSEFVINRAELAKSKTKKRRDEKPGLHIPFLNEYRFGSPIPVIKYL